jgi:DNA-binding NtrC family response regulator
VLAHALRDRVDDVPVLAVRFLARASMRLGRPTPALTSGAAEALMGYAWPGNVRELENLIERLVVLAPREEIDADDLPAAIRTPGSSFASEPPHPPAGSEERLTDLERARILEVLAACNGNKKLAAARLGIHRSTLYAKLDRYRLRE